MTPASVLSKLSTFPTLFLILGRCEQAIFRVIQMRLRCFEKYRNVPHFEACKHYLLTSQAALSHYKTLEHMGVRSRTQVRNCGKETKKAQN